MFLGIDVGTSEVKVILMDEVGQVVATAGTPLELSRPMPRWSEQAPTAWWEATLAAIDRIVHHATILEMNVDSYRRKEAVNKARGAGRPPTRATIKGSS